MRAESLCYACEQCAIERKRDDHGNLSCSFCGKIQKEVKKLIAGPTVYICDECIGLCNDIIAEEIEKDGAALGLAPIPKPAEIKTVLDEYVIGQERAKKILAVAVHNHYKRIDAQGRRRRRRAREVEHPAARPDRLAARRCSRRRWRKILNVPFAIADATTLTEAGYVGEDVENIIVNLLQNADHDIERAQRGIVYIDEIDKIARKSDNPSASPATSRARACSRRCSRSSKARSRNVPPKGGRKHPQQEFLQVDTTNILFICGGAFVGLEDIIEQPHRPEADRLRRRDQVEEGAHASASCSREVQPEDLLKFGMIPEFIGRLPVIAHAARAGRGGADRHPHQAEERAGEAVPEAVRDGRREAASSPRARCRRSRTRRSAHKRGARGLRAILEQRDARHHVRGPVARRGIREVVINEETIQKGQQPILMYQKGAAAAGRWLSSFVESAS